MAYKIYYKKSVLKDLKKINKPDIPDIIQKVEEKLSVNPEAFPSLKGEFKGLRKLRVGNYRIIFNISGKTVLVLRIGHRKNIYK